MKTTDEAIVLINQLAQSDLQDDDISFNAFGLEEYLEQEADWFEWTNEDGDDIMYIIDNKE